MCSLIRVMGAAISRTHDRSTGTAMLGMIPLTS
jgi:hypothetical protein